MNIDFHTTVNDVVMNNLKAARVLKEYDIDLLTEGRRSLADVCREANISFAALLRRIREGAPSCRYTTADIQGLELDRLIAFVEQYHHRPILEAIAFIRPNLARLVRLYGATHEGLEEINSVFRELAAHLTIHMEHEELMLFPYIKQMVRPGKRTRSDSYKSVRSPIASMEHDHDTERSSLRRLQALTHGYTIPPDGGIFYSVTYAALRELEEDLLGHMRLETEILFPKALEMEASLGRGPHPEKRKKRS